MRHLIVILILIAAPILIILGCYLLVSCHAAGRLYSRAADVPQRDAALMLGANPVSRYTGGPNPFYVNRIEAAAQLYKAGRVTRILISGSDRSRGLDETESMRADLVKRGVPAEAIILDHKGYTTYASIIRATRDYGLTSYVIVSQRFHNERALYLADHLNLGTHDLVALNAEGSSKGFSFLSYLREYLARVKMLYTIITQK